MKISCVINVDTRTPRSSANGLFQGVVNEDFLVDGVYNKVKFLQDFDDVEIIVYIDEHNKVPNHVLDAIRGYANVVVVRKHTNEENYNDWNYYRALSMASGDIVIHCDQDTACFTKEKDGIKEMIKLLDNYDYISYPSYWSPYAVHDDSFDHVWASTRFFMCKRETIDFEEYKKCFNYNYWTKTYPVNRVCPWTEHWLGSISKYKGKGVYYPPIDHSKLIIFSWGSYQDGVLMRLNNIDFEDVNKWLSQHPVHYPNDVNA